jgi:hypothetical protein
MLLRFALLLALSCAAMATRAQDDAYAGTQLAPTVHLGVGTPHALGGIGADLSLGRWLDVEVWGSRVSRPFAERWYPGAWSAGVAVQSRVAGSRHAFVYGLGLVYSSRFACPRGCTLSAAIALEEARVVSDMVEAQVRLGYELRLPSRWFVRALLTADLPFAKSDVSYVGPDERYHYDEPPLTFMHGTGLLTAGYAFRLR